MNDQNIKDKVVIFNLDEAAFPYHVPVRKTYDFVGAPRVCLNTCGGGGKKESFTLLLGATSLGKLYPPVVILGGKTFTEEK